MPISVGLVWRGADASGQQRASDVPAGIQRPGRGGLGPQHRAGPGRQCAVGLPAAGLRARGRGPQLLRPAPGHSQPAREHPSHPGRQPGKLPPYPRYDPHAAPLARQRPLAQRRRRLAASAADRCAGIHAKDTPDAGASHRAGDRRSDRSARGLPRMPGRSSRRDAIPRPRDRRPVDVFAGHGSARGGAARARHRLCRASRPAEPPRFSAALADPQPARICAAALSPPLDGADRAAHRRAPRERHPKAHRAICSTCCRTRKGIRTAWPTSSRP